MHEYIFGRGMLNIISQGNMEYHFNYYNADAVVVNIYCITKDNDIVINRSFKHVYNISNQDVHNLIYSKDEIEVKKIELIYKIKRNIAKKLIKNIEFENGLWGL